MTTRASGACSSPPSPMPMAIGTRPEHRWQIDVIRIGPQTRASAELDRFAQRHARRDGAAC